MTSFVGRTVRLDRRFAIVGHSMSGPRRYANVILVVWMLVAIGAVSLLAYWDQLREADASLEDLANAQATLAQGLSLALGERLAAVEREGAAGEARPPIEQVTERVLASISALERPGARRVFVRPPGHDGWIAVADGRTVAASALPASTATEPRAMLLSRPEAADLGLPARMAVAGVARVDAGSLGTWNVGVVTTALVERDREKRAELRFVLVVVVATALVLAFGSAAVRRQRRQMDLTHALEIAEIEKARDERLVTANKLATMGALASGIAHEVATPLGVIVARAEQVVARSDADERVRRAAEIIVAQTERIHAVIRGFLALARGQTPRLVESDPGELASAAVGLVDHRFAKAGVALTSTIGAGLGTIACDPRMFEQVLVNLLLNACDACEAGGTVDVSVRRHDDRIAFVVEDDGAGIDDEAVLRATEPFFTTKPEGTGLGLAITKEIVDHHGGTLALKARPSGGTQAIVEVPASKG